MLKIWRKTLTMEQNERNGSTEEVLPQPLLSSREGLSKLKRSSEYLLATLIMGLILLVLGSLIAVMSAFIIVAMGFKAIVTLIFKNITQVTSRKASFQT